MHPSGVAESSTSFGWGKSGNVTSAGWEVTLCDLIWYVSSRSGVATLRTAIHLLLVTGRQAHFCAIRSPKYANMLKISPTRTRRPARSIAMKHSSVSRCPNVHCNGKIIKTIFCLELGGPALGGPRDFAHPIKPHRYATDALHGRCGFASCQLHGTFVLVHAIQSPRHPRRGRPSTT